MAFAVIVGLDPDYPLAHDAIPRIRVPMDWETKFPVTVAPEGAIEGIVDTFSWSWQGDERAWQVVVLDQATEERLRSSPVSGNRWIPSSEERQRLVSDQRLYWYVVSGEGPWELRSDLRSFSVN